MVEIKNDKIERVLSIYTKLMNGYLIIMAEEEKTLKPMRGVSKGMIFDPWTILDR